MGGETVRKSKWATIGEAGKMLDLSRTRIEQLIREGKIEEEPCTGVRIVTIASVEKLKKEREAKAARA